MEVKWPDPPLDRSILGWDPLDELVVHIGDWLIQEGHDRHNLEIEAKVGRIVEKDSLQRIRLPVRSETIVEMQQGWKFESQMSDKQHGKINELMNQALAHSKGAIVYERQKEVDLFFTDHSSSGGGGFGGGKIRVTKDAATFETKAVVKKTRIADLNVYCPKRALDYRISVNVEEPADEPPTGESDFTREKNRLHYTHQNVYVDLTQIQSQNENQRATNELELEFRNANALLQQAQANVHAAQRQEWTPYYDSILIFLNNVRLLIRNAE